MRKIELIIFMFALSVLISEFGFSEEVANKPKQIFIGAFTAEALDTGMVEATRKKLFEELLILGASILYKPGEGPIERSCFDVPKCLQEAVASMEVSGVLDIRVIRFGPMVRVAIRVFDASTGEKVLETLTIASAKGFPESASLTQDLERILQALIGQGEVTKEEVIREDEKEISTTGGPVEEMVENEEEHAIPLVVEEELEEEVMAKKEEPRQEKPTFHVPEELPVLKKKAAVRLHPYKKWGHISFWSGIGLTAFGGVAAAMFSSSKDDYRSGDWDAESDIKAWHGLMITGFCTGAALVATGLVLWYLASSDSELDQKGADIRAMGASVVTDGSGFIFTIGGRW